MPSCKQCSATFDFSHKDRDFYERVSPVFEDKKELISEPTLCPDCRVQRRMAWRNDRSFYHRKCDLSGKQIISIYPEGTPFPVYHQSVWYGDRWDPMTYGRDIDFSRSFLEQWHELFLAVPRLGMDIVNCENSDYCNYCGDDRNCYLDIAGEANEDCYFDLFTKHSKHCVDCTFAYHCQYCYECIQCYNCYEVKWSQYMEDCSNCSFCFDCKGCKNCLFCVNQRGKEYCILNEQHTKEEYERKLAELSLDHHSALTQAADLWKRMWIEKGIYRDMYNLSCEDCVGNDLKNSKHCTSCFNATNCRDCKYLYDVLDATDCQDLNYSLYKPELSYELISTLQMHGSAFNMASHYCSNVFYCDLTNNSQDLFGCIGLNRKRHCILNKQYTKEEYEALVPKIIDHMRKDGSAMNPSPSVALVTGSASGSWGEFFPVALSPFAYNETVAQEYQPLTEDDVHRRGWKWKSENEQERYLGPSTPLPDGIAEANSEVASRILTCEVSGKQYRIIPQELAFYRTHGIPLPRRSPHQRHLDRNALRNPRTLFDRVCAKCSKSIQTTFAPERPEKVYCEECYLEEVY
jgi:CxxC-x17-CxxC domain-containing protein